MTDTAKIHDRIQKLLAMAKDASSPNEAMIAMERARRLMDKYQIEETDLESVEENRFASNFLFSKSYKFMPAWMNIMATALCKLNGVVGGVVQGDIGIAGLEEDVILTKAMFERLSTECIRLCKLDQVLRGHSDRYNAKVGDAFKKGFASAIAMKINEIIESQASSEPQTSALVVRKMDIIEAKFGKMNTKSKATKTRADAETRDAYTSGIAHGSRTAIQSEVN